MPSLAESINLWTNPPAVHRFVGRVAPHAASACTAHMPARSNDAALLAWLDEVLPLREVDPAPRVISRATALLTVGANAISYRCRVGRWQRLAPSVYMTKRPATPPDLLRSRLTTTPRRSRVTRCFRPLDTLCCTSSPASLATPRLSSNWSGAGSLRLSADAHDHLCSKRRLWRPSQS